MNACLYVIPYDSGHRDVRMGRGPLHLLERGLPARLSELFANVRVRHIRSDDEFTHEIGTGFRLYAKLAAAIRDADPEELPIILAGNCGAAAGAIGGIANSASETGLIWLDAHGDFHTPDDSTSGFLDGMAISFATGRCFNALVERIPGFVPISTRNVIHVAGRDIDPPESAAFAEEGVSVVSTPMLRDGTFFPAAVKELARRSSRVVFHLDVDSLDPDVVAANSYAAPGGLTVEDLAQCAEETASEIEIAAIVVAAYDPAADPRESAAHAVLDSVVAVARAAVASRTPTGRDS